jgi:hypothetical protein
VFYWLQLIVCSYQLAATTTILSIGFHLSFFDSQVIIHTSVYHIFSEEISSQKKTRVHPSKLTIQINMAAHLFPAKTRRKRLANIF